MTKEERKEEQYRLLSEKVVNESWSKVEKYTNELIEILEKEELDEREFELIIMAARAFVQKILMERADNIALFGMDFYSTSPCGQNLKGDCPCDRGVCLLRL